jgi:hypothetical protein
MRHGHSVAAVLIGALLLLAPTTPQAADADCHSYALELDDQARALLDESQLDDAIKAGCGLARQSEATADIRVRIRAKASSHRVSSATGMTKDSFGASLRVTADWRAPRSSDAWQSLLSPTEARSSSDRFMDSASAAASARATWQRSKQQGFVRGVTEALGRKALGACPIPVAAPEPAPRATTVPADAGAFVPSVDPPPDTTTPDPVLRSLLLGVVGLVLVVVTLVIAVRLRKKLDRFGQLALLVFLALAAGAAVGILAGQINVTTDKTYGMGVSATGGLAVFVIVLSLGYRFLSGDKGKSDKGKEE